MRNHRIRPGLAGRRSTRSETTSPRHVVWVIRHEETRHASSRSSAQAANSFALAVANHLLRGAHPPHIAKISDATRWRYPHIRNNRRVVHTRRTTNPANARSHRGIDVPSGRSIHDLCTDWTVTQDRHTMSSYRVVIQACFTVVVTAPLRASCDDGAICLV